MFLGTRSRKGMLSDALIKCKSMNPVIYLKEFQQMKNDDSATVQFEKIISEGKINNLKIPRFGSATISLTHNIRKMVTHAGAVLLHSFRSDNTDCTGLLRFIDT